MIRTIAFDVVLLALVLTTREPVLLLAATVLCVGDAIAWRNGDHGHDSTWSDEW